MFQRHSTAPRFKASAPVLLSMGAGIDWSAQCVRTRFAAVPVVAHRHADTRRSISITTASRRDYLSQWVTHALRDPLVVFEPSCRSSR